MKKKTIKLFIFLIAFILISKASFALLDTTKLGLGARSVSLGRCSVALFNDVNSMFINPALSTPLKVYNLSSMYVNLSEDISYTQLGGAWPTEWGSFGVSYLGAGCGGLIETEIQSGRIVPTGFTFDYASSLYSIIYGNKYREDIWYGVGLKFFHQSFTSFGSGNGFDLDISLLWLPNEKLKVGLSQQNTLPFSLGGKVHWTTGHEEGIPFNTKLGLSYQFNPYWLLLSDIDYAKNRPLLLHLGCEWTPLDFLALRLGLDQYAENPNSAVSNYTLGLGLKYRAFQFDYAYYYDNLLPYNNSHFFSLRFVPEIKKEVEKPVVVKKPIIYLKTFIDVTYPYWAREEIEYLATVDVIQGYPDKTFKPERTLTRAEMVTLLARATATSDAFSESTFSYFKDVVKTHWAKKYIEYAVQKRWVKGFPDGTFKPNKTLTRAEAITILSRFEGLKVRETIAVSPFDDVSTKHWAYKDIALAKDVGWLNYIKEANLFPNKGMSRAEAAYVLFRTSFAQKKINDLKEKYEVIRPDVP